MHYTIYNKSIMAAHQIKGLCHVGLLQQLISVLISLIWKMEKGKNNKDVFANSLFKKEM